MSSRSRKEEDPRDLDTRCPRLGGTVPFRYCLAPGEPKPCFKVFDCWWEIFDVSAYLRSHLPGDVVVALLEGHHNKPDRLNTILELVEKFKGTKPDDESR